MGWSEDGAAVTTGWRCPRCGERDENALALYRADGVFNRHSKRFGPWCRECRSRIIFHEGDGLAAPIPFSSSARVLLLSGPCASGKSAVSYLLSERYGLAQIDGDWILDLLRRELGRKVGFEETHEEMLAMAAGMVALGRSAVIAHVILPDAFARYGAYLTARGIAYRAAILMPGMPTLLERNRTRDCWPKPTPEYWVRRFVDDLCAGPEDVRALFYDNSCETEEQTAQRLWELLQSVAEAP
jgi:DNA-directed RNA polymerase subunit RPC12/RpoP